MASVYDNMINPVTGRSYGERFATGGANVGGAWNPTSFFTPKVETPKPDPGYLNMREQVKTGADFSKYQEQLDKLLQDQSRNKYQQQIDRLLADPNAFQETAGYKAAVEQGNHAINRRAAAGGMLGSGNVMAELMKYGQGMASQEYGNQLSRLAGLNAQSQQDYLSNNGRLADLMRGAQQFGLQSKYYDEPTRTTSGWEGGGFVSRRDENPSYW